MSDWQFEKKIPFFSSNNLFFCCYLKVDLFVSLSGLGTDDKKPKIGRIKVKIIYFKVSNYGKKVKNLDFYFFFEKILIFELE